MADMDTLSDIDTLGVGIDATNVYVSPLRLEAKEIERATGHSVGKVKKGMGIESCTLPASWQDFVTQAAEAAHGLLQEENVDPSEIGWIGVGTESHLGPSKTAASYLQGALESHPAYDQGAFDHARTRDSRDACAGGTEAMNEAAYYLLSPRADEDEKALVVVSDTAFYQRGDDGEPTQGAGAVAKLLGRDPDIADLTVAQGVQSVDEDDFHKSDEDHGGRQYPWVDGHRSMGVYLELSRRALNDFQADMGPLNPDDIDFAVWHNPFKNMTDKVAPLGFRNLVRGTETEDELRRALEEQLGDPKAARNALIETETEFIEAISETEPYQEFKARALDTPRRVSGLTGNWYAGSLPRDTVMGLVYLKEEGADAGFGLRGTYGSGATAMVDGIVIQPGFEEKVDADMVEQVEAAESLSADQYHRLHAHHRKGDEFTLFEPFVEPDGNFVRDGTENGRPVYDFVE